MRGGVDGSSGRDGSHGEVRQRRMKPSKKPAGTVSLPRARLKARKRSQMTCVSTGQGRLRSLDQLRPTCLENVHSSRDVDSS